MTTLRALWEFSLALCLLAAVALLALLFARVLAARFTGQRALTRQALLPVLLDGDPARLQPLAGLERRVATDLTIELAEMTRGSERQILLERAKALGVADLLVRRLGSYSAQTRLTAAEALALFDDRREEVARALDDRNPDVRLGAALALAQQHEAPDPLTLISKLKVGEEENSLLLVSLMADLAAKDPEAVAGLLFEKDLSYEAKVAAVDALADLGGTYAPLLAYMAQESVGEHDLQPRVFRALGRTGHPAGSQAIMAGLNSETWSVRAAAAEASGKAGLVAAADRLGTLLQDDHFWVRFRAGEALLRLGPRGLSALHRAAESDNEDAREVATKILREGRAA